MIKDFTDAMGSLYGAPGYVIVFLSTIVFGYVLRAIKRFPNAGIPVAVVLWGAVCNIMLADVYSPPASLRLWLTKNLLIGFIIGFVSWSFHKVFLKRFEEKLPWLKGAFESTDQYKADQPGWAKEGVDPKEKILNPQSLSEIDKAVEPKAP